MTKNKDPMLQELGASLKPCAICLQPKSVIQYGERNYL